MKAQIQNSLFQVSEIKVNYQPNFKASERPQISVYLISLKDKGLPIVLFDR